MRLLNTTLLLALLPTIGVNAQNPPPAQPIAYDYSILYDALNPSIVKVHADGGSGSGFLLSPEGLIATNHHVVRNSRYLAVQFADGRKVTAQVVTLDPQHDVAILKVNRSIVGSLKPLPLLPAERDVEVKAGVPVLAFGSPLSQTFLMTQGIVAKVEENVLLGDFLLQRGNSGGPLVNLKGEVVGINTFAEQAISGAVRAGTLRRILASQEVRGYDRADPPATLLPRVSARRYPTEVLKEKIAREPLEVKAYQLDAGKFTVTAITPVLIGKLQVQEDLVQARNRFQRRGKKVGDPSWREVDAPFYEWSRNATHFLEHAVTFEVKPDFGSTAGSLWAAALSGLAAGLSKTPAQPVHQTMEFKAEFQDFKVYKDNEFVQPIHPGRAITESALQGAFVTFVDEAYSGMYAYAPEVFMDGREFRIEVYDAREPGKPHRTLILSPDHKLVQQIRRDFAEAQDGTRETLAPHQTEKQTTQRGDESASDWATNLAGTSAQLEVRDDAIIIRFKGGAQLSGVEVILARKSEGYSGSYVPPGCSTSGSVELRQIAAGWQGSIETIDCKSVPVSRVRTGLLLRRLEEK